MRAFALLSAEVTAGDGNLNFPSVSTDLTAMISKRVGPKIFKKCYTPALIC